MANIFSSGRVSWINPIMVFSRAASLLRTCFLPVAGLSLAGMIPASAASIFDVTNPGMGVIASFFNLAMGAAASLVIVRSCLEEDLEVSACVKAAFTGKMVLLALLGLFIFMPIILALIFVFYSYSELAAGVLIIILLMLLLIRVLVIFMMAVPACALENKGAFASMKISRILVRGNYLTIMFSWLLAVLIEAFLVIALFKAAENFVPSLSAVTNIFNPGGLVNFSDFLMRDNLGLDIQLVFAAAQFITMFLANLINGAIFAELLINREDEEMKTMAEVFE
jgi:hypothetical protein